MHYGYILQLYNVQYLRLSFSQSLETTEAQILVSIPASLLLLSLLCVIIKHCSNWALLLSTLLNSNPTLTPLSNLPLGSSKADFYYYLVVLD